MWAISLWQPWASLWASGVKEHETRGWRCDDKLGQTIAIHAAKKLIGRAALDAVCARLCAETFGPFWEKTLPRGALVGEGRLVACWRTEQRRAQVGEAELALGDWSTGRFAWQLAERRAPFNPIPCAGRQGWFPAPELKP